MADPDIIAGAAGSLPPELAGYRGRVCRWLSDRLVLEGLIARHTALGIVWFDADGKSSGAKMAVQQA